MRTFYCILIIAAALATWFPYAAGAGTTMSLVDSLIGGAAAVERGLVAALPFLLLGLVGQTALPPARRPLARFPLGVLLAAIVAVAIDAAGHLLELAVEGLLVWQLGAAVAGILLALLPPVRRRMEMGWLDGAAAAAALLLLYILYRLYPYGFSIDPGNVSENLKPLIKFLVFSPTDYARELAGWLAVAAMLARVGPERLSSFVLLIFAALVLAAEVHVPGNVLTVSDGAALLTAFLLHGFVLGWLPGRNAIYGLLIFALLAVAGLQLAGLTPPAMRSTAVALEWRPFVTLLQDNGGAAAAFGMFWVFLFSAVVWLFRVAGFGNFGAGAVTIVAFCGLEALRLLVEGRAPDLAAPLVALLAAIGLAGLNRRPRRRWRPEETQSMAAAMPAAAAAAAAAPAVYDDPRRDEPDEVADAWDEEVAAAEVADPDSEAYDADNCEDEYDREPEDDRTNWAMEPSGGELAHDDAGSDSAHASASGYVPEEIIEGEEIEEYDEPDPQEPYETVHEDEVDYLDQAEYEEEAEYEDEDHYDEADEYLPEEEPEDPETVALASGEEAVEEDVDAAPALTLSDALFAIARLVLGIPLVGGLLIGLQAFLGDAGPMPALLKEAGKLDLVLLGAIMLVVGLAAAVVGRLAATTRLPLLLLPALGLLAGVLLVFLVSGALGDRWLTAVIGVPAMFDGIVRSSFGGDLGAALVNSIPNNQAFDALELLVRGACLFVLLILPIAAFVAVFMRMADYPDIRGGGRVMLGAIVVLVFVGSALPWLVLVKFAIFNVPLNGGLVSLVPAGREAYVLLAILLLIGWNAALLGRPVRGGLATAVLLRLAATGLALAIGFVLGAVAFQPALNGGGLNALLAPAGAPVLQVAVVWAGLQLLLVAAFGYGCRILPAYPGATAEADGVGDDEDD